MCKSKPSLSFLDCFAMLHANICGFLCHRAELEARLEMLGFPTLVCITESWLDSSTKHPTLTEYVLISRRDRSTNKNRGDILLFALKSAAPAIAHVGDSGLHERSWHIYHCNQGPIFIGLWYRQPHYGEVASIDTLKLEIEKYRHDAIGVCLTGDMNVHHKPWLTFSSRCTPEGARLQDVCKRLCLTECVKKPTRGNYLLDLVLTDLEHAITTHVVSGVSDHHMVL